VQVDGKRGGLALRSKRTYYPYRLELIDFVHQRYPGTSKPKAYESHVRVMRGEDEMLLEKRIEMNDPLRYDGKTFYQADFDNNDRTTILQVVDNPGWWIPYASCVIVSLGLLVHFGIALVRFARRSVA
jgi:hypothetical protein